MPQSSFDYRYGIRKSSALVNINASGVAVPLFTPAGVALTAPTVPGAIGRTAVIRKIWAFNEGGLTANIEFGVGIVGVGTGYLQRIPAFPLLAGQVVTMTEDEVPNVEFEQQITVMNSAAGATDVDIVIEVSEYEGGAAPV